MNSRVGNKNIRIFLSVTLRLVVVQLLSPVQLFAILWTAACRTSLSSTISQSLLKFMSIESVMLSRHPDYTPMQSFFFHLSISHQPSFLSLLPFLLFFFSFSFSSISHSFPCFPFLSLCVERRLLNESNNLVQYRRTFRLRITMQAKLRKMCKVSLV